MKKLIILVFMLSMAGCISMPKRFIDTRKNGEIISYYNNGNIKSKKNYKEGLCDGFYVEYYDNGNIMREQNFRDGHKEGLCSYYNEDGVKIEEGIYKKGLRHGVWYSFDPENKSYTTTDYGNKGFVNPEDSL